VVEVSVQSWARVLFHRPPTLATTQSVEMSAPIVEKTIVIDTNYQARYMLLYNGSPHSQKVIEYMKRFGLKNAKIFLYAAFPLGPVSAPGVTDWAQIERDTKRHDMERLLEKAKAELVAAGFRADDISFVIVESDDIRDSALDFSLEQRIDTIVVGTRGLGALKRAFLGSTSTYLVENATTTVVICRDKK